MGKKGKKGGKGGGGGDSGQAGPPAEASGGQPGPSQGGGKKKGGQQGQGGQQPQGEPSRPRQPQTPVQTPSQEAFPTLGSTVGQGPKGAWGGKAQSPATPTSPTSPTGPPQYQQQRGPPQQQGHAQQQRGPPQQQRGPPQHQDQQQQQQQQRGPPQQQGYPQQHQRGPPQQQGYPQQQQRGQPQQQDYPQQQQRGPPQQQGQQQQRGPPQQQYQQQGPPQQQYQQQGPPQQQGQQQQYQQQGPPQQQRGPPQQQMPQQQQQRGAPQQRGPPQQQQQARPPFQPQAAQQPPAKYPSPPPTAEMKHMSLESIPKRKQRPQVAKRGDTIRVETNHLALTIKNPRMVVFHYDVAVSPEKPYRHYRPAVMAVQQRCFPNRHPAFDGKKNLYAYPELPLDKRELVETVKVFDDERQGYKEITVTIKFAASVDISAILEYFRTGSSTNVPQEAIQALDIVLRQPAANRFVTVGRSFFTKPPGQIISLGDGLDLWYGFFQSAILGWKPYLNIDVAHKGFPSPVSCLQALGEVCQCSYQDLQNPNFTVEPFKLKMFLDHLKNLKVIQAIPNSQIKRTYKVIGIADPPRKNTFQCDDRNTGERKSMTVEQYFANTYRIKLRFPHLPCLKAGTPDKSVALPIELCTIMEGQVTIKKMNEIQTRNMVKEAAVDTGKRKSKIMQSIKEVAFNQDPCIREFGLSVADNFTKVEARILPPPTVDYKDRTNNIIKARVERGVWRMNEVKFLSGAEISKWCILNTNKRVRDDEIRNLVSGLTKCGRDCGLNILDSPQVVFFDQTHKIEDYFRTCQKNEVKLIIVILPDRGVTYASIKKMAELNVGVLTQCLKTITVQRRANPSTFVNILQKINAKLNGVNHNITPHLWPEFFKRPVMVVGADVTHPAPDQSYVPSIAAVAASHDPKAFKYNMIWKLQPPREEVIADLKNIMVQQLKFFFASTNLKPEKILFYRDGVSEGQFRKILDVELRAIRAACASLSSSYQPPITFLVVQKRHHTRFFPSAADADGKNKNVPAGTVVDTEITHPTELDFYLVSHASIQGTARPTKYHLLWDDANMSEQELEEITYYLCHLFTRCTRSVSYPAPTYYAHLAAFRARSYTETEGNTRLNLDQLDQEQTRRQVKEGIIKNNPMFFV